MFGQGNVPSQLSILLVEDDALQQKIIQRRLERESFLVTAVSNAVDALAKICQHDFAIAIVDLGLPDSKGLDLVRELNAKSKSTKLIICTADSSFTLAKESLNLGVAGYVEKSEDFRVLIARVHHAATEYLHEELTRAEGEIRFHLRVLDVIEDGVIATNLNCELIYWNRYAVNLIGKDEMFVAGTSAMDFLCVRKTCRGVTQLLNQIQSGLNATGHARLRRYVNDPAKGSKQLTRVPVRFTASPILNGANCMVGYVFSFSDITRERKAQRVLKEIAEQQTALAQIGALAFSAEDIISFLNVVAPCIKEIMRVDDCAFFAEQTVSSPTAHQEDLRIHQSLAQKSLKHSHYVPIRSSNSARLVCTMVLGSRTQKNFTASDRVFLKSVAELVANTMERFAASSRWKSLFENSLNAVMLIDERGIFVDANDAAAELLQYSRVEIQGLQVADIICERELDAFNAIWNGVQNQHTYSGEMRLVTKFEMVRETKYVVVLNVFPGLHMIDFRDITEERRLEEKVHQDLAVLANSQRSAVILQTTAILAHEINQPLGAISNFVGGLLLGLEKGRLPDLVETLGDIQQEAMRASNIVKKLRWFVSDNSQEPKQVNLNALILETLKLLQSDFRVHSIGTELQLEENLPMTIGDSVQLQQVLVNLLRNAVEAMNGRVDGASIVKISTSSTDSNVTIQITDNGPKISDSQFVKMFEPYFTSKSDGLGLGLSISKTIVEQYFGQIHAARIDEGGMKLTVCLPTSNVKSQSN